MKPVLHHHHNNFTALFPGPHGWAGARRELLDFMVQAKINRGRHTDHPAGRHSIRTNQCPPPPSPYFLQARWPSRRPTNSVKALKATSAFGLGRRRLTVLRAPTANPPNSAQLEGTPYHSLNLHLVRAVVWEYKQGRYRQTHRWPWPIYISPWLRLTRNVMTDYCWALTNYRK